MHHAQNNFCRCLIIVPLTTFHRLAETIGDLKGELIFLFHIPRSGSTLLTQVYGKRHAKLLVLLFWLHCMSTDWRSRVSFWLCARVTSEID